METVTPRHTAYPEPIQTLIERHHHGGIEAQACLGCNAACCRRGGFALLENVEQIYGLYRQGKLARADYQFVGGLSFREFVQQYFDAQTWSPEGDGGQRRLMLFYMKSLGPGGNLVTVPAEPDTYRETREELFASNPWLNKGCIFLSEALPTLAASDPRRERRCMLHDARSAHSLSAKPVDCVRATCTTPGREKPMSGEETARWLTVLAEHYPGSVARFERLTAA